MSAYTPRKLTKRERKTIKGPSHVAFLHAQAGYSKPEPQFKIVEEMGIKKPILVGMTKGVPYVNKNNFPLHFY